MTKAQMRFERYQLTRTVLREAEDRLRERMENKRKAKEQFNEVQMELERLTSEKLTMVPSLD
jgi:hypothetical protein